MTFNPRIADVLDRYSSTSGVPPNQASLPQNQINTSDSCGLYAEEAPISLNDTIIVVVDDDESLRALICEALRRVGFRTCGRSSAKDALEFLLAQKSNRAILVTDLVLNGSEGGWSLAQRARQLLPSVPILLMSGYIDEPVVQDAIAKGKTSFLPKPFDLSALVSTVKSLMKAA